MISLNWVKDYIDIENEKLLLEMSVIPSGGLRATIYSEILKIKRVSNKSS